MICRYGISTVQVWISQYSTKDGRHGAPRYKLSTLQVLISKYSITDGWRGAPWFELRITELCRFEPCSITLHPCLTFMVPRAIAPQCLDIIAATVPLPAEFKLFNYGVLLFSYQKPHNSIHVVIIYVIMYIYIHRGNTCHTKYGTASTLKKG